MLDPDSPWEQWNIALFLKLHATAHSPHWLVATAAVLTELPLAVAVVLTLWQLFRHRDGVGTVRIVLACSVAILTEALIGVFAFHPRPFAAGFGPAWVEHAANNSMPSTHVTLAWTMALTLALRGRRWTGAALFVLGGILAWARVYVGIHWPADMIGAALSAGLSVALAYLLQRGLQPLFARCRKLLPRHRSSGHHVVAASRTSPNPSQRDG